MSDNKIYSYNDLDLLSKKYAKVIDNEFEKLNQNKNIIHPTEQKYKELLENTLKEVTGTGQCLGTYVSGKHKGEHCKASPHINSKYCLKHQTQDPEKKKAKRRISELIKLKNNEQNPEEKKNYETEIMELVERFKMND